MMDKVRNFTFVFYLFLVAFQGYSQTKNKEAFTLYSKEKVKYTFSILSLIEKSELPTDTIKLKFTFSLLTENETEVPNENVFTFKMKYTKSNSLVALQNLPDNIIGKLGIASNKFPPNYETFCREKIVKNMVATFRQVESNLKLKKVGFFE
jgi:hypothetical protein